MPIPDVSSFDPSWQPVLSRATVQPSFAELMQFVEAECAAGRVFPPNECVYEALHLTPLDRVQAVIVGQDPYHDDGQAHGLAFSVRPGIKPPPSLRNILAEWRADLGHPLPAHGCLDAWARAGVLLLNDVLTVRAHQAGSHQGRGWEAFTDQILSAVNDLSRPIVFLLWGTPAKKKGRLIDRQRHIVIESVHPSPLSAHRGFLGSRPFSRANRELVDRGMHPIDWKLPS